MTRTILALTLLLISTGCGKAPVTSAATTSIVPVQVSFCGHLFTIDQSTTGLADVYYSADYLPPYNEVKPVQTPAAQNPYFVPSFGSGFSNAGSDTPSKYSEPTKTDRGYKYPQGVYGNQECHVATI